MYSLAVTFYEIVMGSLPDMTPGAVPAPLVRVVERRGSGQDRASKLIEFVLHGDPKKRPTAKMVLAHVRGEEVPVDETVEEEEFVVRPVPEHFKAPLFRNFFAEVEPWGLDADGFKRWLLASQAGKKLAKKDKLETFTGCDGLSLLINGDLLQRIFRKHRNHNGVLLLEDLKLTVGAVATLKKQAQDAGLPFYSWVCQSCLDDAFAVSNLLDYKWIELLDASRGGESEYGMDIFVHRLGEYGMDIFIHHLVSRFDEKKHVVLKMTPRVTMDDAEAMQLQQRAAAVSEFVLSLLHWGFTETHSYAMMELPSQQYYTLRHKLDGVGKGGRFREPTDDSEKWKLYLQLTTLLADLHDAGVFFLILTPDYILLDAYGDIRYCEFTPALSDASTLYEEVEREKKYSLAGAYSPPELAEADGRTRFSAKVDIWTVGVTVLEIARDLGFAKLSHLTDEEREEMLQEIDDGDGVKALLRPALQKDPAARPTAREFAELVRESRRAQIGDPPKQPVQVTVPPGAAPGMELQIKHPITFEVVTVEVPQGATPGTAIEVDI